MTLTFNNKETNNITFNGKEVVKVTWKGTTIVWQKSLSQPTNLELKENKTK